MAQTLADIAPDDIIWGDSAAVQPPANNDWLTSAPRVALHDVDPADIDWWEMGRWRDRTLVESAQKTIGEAGNAVARGLAMSRLASEMEQPEPDPAKIIEIQREIAQNPPSAEFQTVMNDNATPQESWSAFTRNPVGVVNELMLDSLSSYASQMFEKAPARVAVGAGAGAAIGAPVFGYGAIPAGATGALAGFAQSGGAASYSLEMAGGILESLEQAGVNMGSPEELGAALQDEQRMQVAREFAQKKAIPVAAFDTVSALIAGRVMGAKPATVLQKLGRGMVETAVQSVLGMSGEAAGQLSQSGEITSVRQIGAEGIGEIAPGMIEVGVGTGVQALQGQQPAATAPAAAPSAQQAAAPFTPPQQADTVVVEEVFGDPTTAATEPAPATDGTTASVPMMITRQMEADLLARGFSQEDINKMTPQQANDILATPPEVVQEPSETIVTEPPAAPRFQFDLADDAATAPEMDAAADVFAGVPQQQAPVVAQEPEVAAPAETPIDVAPEPVAQSQPVTGQAAPSSFTQAFRSAKKTEDKKLAVMKAVADNSFLPAVIDAAETGKPLPSMERFKDSFPYEGVALPGRVDLSKVAIKPIKPAAPDVAARSHAAKDSSRFVLEGVYYDAESQSVVGTDGRRLIAIPQKVEGKSRIISATDGREIQGQFPNWKQIIPKVDKDTILFNVDIDKARRAGTVLSGINKTLKSLVIPAKVKVGMATLDPIYVKDSVEALVASGAKKVYAASKDDASPVMLRGDNGAMAIIMPMRGGKNELVVDASTVIGEFIGNEGREVRQMFTSADPDAPAKKSRRRIKNMTAQSGAIDLSIVEDLVEYGKTIYRAGMSFGKWAGQMVKEFGQGIASFLKQAFDRIVQAYKDSPYSDTTGAVGDVRPKAKPRQFEQKAAQAPGISEEARAQMGDDPYVPITLRGVAEQAKAWIGENGIEAAERRILGLADEGQTPTPLDFAIGLELTANLSATGNAGRAAAVVRTMSRRATSLGQTISTLAMLSRLTPEGIVFYANQIIEQHISSLTPERQAEIRAAQDDVANLEETVATTRKRTAEDSIINGTQGGEKIQDKLKRRIPDKAKKQDANVSIRSVLTSQATKAEATKQITQILTESGISQSEATALATAITSRFYKVLEDARKALATSRKPAKGKGRVTIDKLLTQLKDGKITDEEFVSALAQVRGVPALTAADKARIQNLATQYKASTDDQISLVLAARLFEEVHSIIPPDFWVKLRALSYLSMLFAPKTWIRNIGGNQIQWIANAGRDAVINMVVDPTMSLLTGRRTSAFGNTKRLRSLLTPFEDVIRGYKWNQQQNPSASFKDNAKAGIEHLRVLAKMTTQNKFEITDAKEVGRRIFSSKFMARWETALSIALGGGDRGFWMSAFTASLGQREAAAKKNGEWTGQPTPEDIEAAYADAMHSIYQNPNVISQSANRIRAALNRISTFGRTDQFGLGTALLAFTQVPGSITMRGLIEWSPLGMINALYEGMRPLLYKATNGKGGGAFRQEQFNKAFTQALLGSGGLFVGGYWLYALGVVTASREEDDDLEAMRRASGLGGYRVNLSALKRLFSTYTKQEPEDGDLIVSYDWAQPLAITFAAGAELAKQVEQNDREGIKKGLAGKAGMAAISLAAGAKSLEEQPLLSGLSSFMKTWGYSGPLDAVVNTISGIPSMFVPQLVRQANQLMDNTVRETRGDEGMMRAFSRIAANTPGVADQFPPRMDIMGQAIERYQYAGNNVINVLINPALTSRVKTNPALQEVARLMQTTGEASQAPRQVGRSVAINGENINLSNEQISAYQYYLGNYTMSMFNWRMASPRYARLPDTEKVKLLAQDLEDVNAATKSALFGHDVRRLTRRQRVMRANLVNSPLGQSMPPR
jgi:hypothetical protein